MYLCIYVSEASAGSYNSAPFVHASRRIRRCTLKEHDDLSSRTSCVTLVSAFVGVVLIHSDVLVCLCCYIENELATILFIG